MRCPFCGVDNIVGMDSCDGCGHSLSPFAYPPRYKTVIEESLEAGSLGEVKPVEPVSVAPQATVEEAVRLLAEHNIGCVLVVWCDALIGIFSERDVLMKIGTRYAELAHEPVRHFMTPAPETLTEEDSVAFAMNRMAVGDFRHIPIEKDERPVGIVSARDVLRYVAEHFPEFATAV